MSSPCPEDAIELLEDDDVPDDDQGGKYVRYRPIRDRASSWVQQLRSKELRKKVLAKGVKFIRGKAAKRADLPVRELRASRVKRRALVGQAVAGAGIGAILGGPIGAGIGAAIGLATGALTSAVMLSPGWPSANHPPPFMPVAPGRDVNVHPVDNTPLLDESFQQELDALTDSRRTTGNAVELLNTGTSAYAARFDLMQNATKSIHLQTYIFHDDETGHAVAKLLMKKAKEGLDVRVIVDGVGSADTGSAIFEKMRDAGVQVVEFSPPMSALGRVNQRWHQKKLVVDGEAAIVGGMNVGSEYAYAGSGRVDVSRGTTSASAMWMRDSDVLVKGPSAQDVGRSFNENWKLATGEELSDPHAPAPQGNVTARFIRHLPKDGKPAHMAEYFVRMLGKARKTAYFSNAYFVPTAEVVEAMKAAAKRGVDVRVLTNAPDTTDAATPMVQQAGRSSFEALIQAGVRVYEAVSRGKVLRVLHRKTAVFDGMVSAIGSYNLDPRSENLNSEDLMVVHDRDSGVEMTRVFGNDLQRAKEVTLQDLHAGTVLDRFEQWLYGDVARSQF